MSTVKSFLLNFKVVHPENLVFLKKLFLIICPKYSVFPTFFSEIYIHCAGEVNQHHAGEVLHYMSTHAGEVLHYMSTHAGEVLHYMSTHAGEVLHYMSTHAGEVLHYMSTHAGEVLHYMSTHAGEVLHYMSTHAGEVLHYMSTHAGEVLHYMLAADVKDAVFLVLFLSCFISFLFYFGFVTLRE